MAPGAGVCTFRPKRKGRAEKRPFRGRLVAIEPRFSSLAGPPAKAGLQVGGRRRFAVVNWYREPREVSRYRSLHSEAAVGSRTIDYCLNQRKVRRCRRPGRQPVSAAIGSSRCRRPKRTNSPDPARRGRQVCRRRDPISIPRSGHRSRERGPLKPGEMQVDTPEWMKNRPELLKRQDRLRACWCIAAMSGR